MSILAGRTALVTGGGTGIGEAVAYDLANAGVDVTVCGRRLEPLEDTVRQIESRGGKARAIAADLTDPEAIESLAEQMLSAGAVDILVNNAGFSSKVRSARFIGADEWRGVMDVNTMGPAMLTKALLPAMIERGKGDVVLISSMAAIRPNILAGAAYSAAKIAAKAYMEVLSSEVRRYGIRCTTVYPGEVDTPILENRALPPKQDVRELMLQSEDISAAVMMAVSLPHRATATEIAVSPTAPRDFTEEVNAAFAKQTAEDRG
jgi:NADP-dependent 3-hydroxy acid dehydrogenase YdfG